MAAIKSHGATLTFVAGGDIGPFIEPIEQIAEKIPRVWRDADVRFGQCERTYSERGYEPQFTKSSRGGHTRLHPRMASIWKIAGVDVISMASNHAMDWGPEALLDTCELFRGMGKHVIGAGRDSEEARRSAIIERNGVKVAFLAYCSVLRDGQAAGPRKPGMAPMRAQTHYVPEDFQPGTPPKIISVPNDEDMAALRQDVKAAKERANAVVVSLHWGLRLVPKTIATYQPPVAHAAIDAGADLIIGHHAHVPKAVEVYKGKVCFYSIGNFMTHGSLRKPFEWNLVWFPMDAECYPPHGKYHFPSHCRNTMIAKAVFSKQGVERVSFVPAYINSQAQPEVVAPDTARFKELLAYMEWVSDEHPHKFRVDGGEVVVETAV